MDRAIQVIDVETFFYIRVGVTKPIWTLTNDSNVLCLGTTPSLASVSVQLENQEAARIRTVDEAVEQMQCSAMFLGARLTFFIIGHQISAGTWRGIASAHSNFDLTDAMMAELSVRIPNNVIKLPVKRIG